jgi:Ca2+-binding RTX toxin-like protein
MGGGSDDCIVGGSGRETIDGGRGDDHIVAVDGSRDRVSSTQGVDSIFLDSEDVSDVVGDRIFCIMVDIGEACWYRMPRPRPG